MEERLKSHNEPGKDWTAKYRPWKIISTKEFETKNMNYFKTGKQMKRQKQSTVKYKDLLPLIIKQEIKISF